MDSFGKVKKTTVLKPVTVHNCPVCGGEAAKDSLTNKFLCQNRACEWVEDGWPGQLVKKFVQNERSSKRTCLRLRTHGPTFILKETKFINTRTAAGLCHLLEAPDGWRGWLPVAELQDETVVPPLYEF